MKRIIQFLKTTMDIPQPFGAFHLVFCALTITITACLCIFLRDSSDKVYTRTLVIIWAIMFIMEGIKQLEESATIGTNGNIIWAYQWTTFPLQLCDTPLYLLLPVAFLKDGKFRTALSTYMSTYILLGGLATYALSSTSFNTTAYVNVQTMVHHGLQIASCALIGVHNRRNIKLKNFALALPVFVISVGIATGFNVGMHKLFPDVYINMFFISPYFKKTMPIFSDAWQIMSTADMLFLYIVALTAIALAIYLIYGLIFYRTGNPKKEKVVPAKA